MPSLATAPQNRTNVNVNLAVRELEMRAATQATPQFRANYHEFHPASSEPQDFGVNTGEMVWTRVKDAPGAQRRANVFTSFNMMAFPLSNLEREGKNSLTRDEQAWLYAKSQYRCVGIAVKDTAYSKGSTHIVDPPVITVTGTIDILNLGPKSIKAMDLIMACIPTAAERRHPRRAWLKKHRCRRGRFLLEHSHVLHYPDNRSHPQPAWDYEHRNLTPGRRGPQAFCGQVRYHTLHVGNRRGRISCHPHTGRIGRVRLC